MRCDAIQGALLRERESASARERWKRERERPGSAEAELPYCHYRREEVNHYPVTVSAWRRTKYTCPYGYRALFGGYLKKKNAFHFTLD